MIFLSKHISLYALCRLKWILDIVWPLNQHFNLKNQKNWKTTFFMLRFLIGIICILLQRPKKLTLKPNTSAHPNPTIWVLKQFSKGLFSWYFIIILLILGKIAWTNLIKTVITYTKPLKSVPIYFSSSLFQFFWSNYTVFIKLFHGILPKSRRTIIDYKLNTLVKILSNNLL